MKCIFYEEKKNFKKSQKQNQKAIIYFNFRITNRNRFDSSITINNSIKRKKRTKYIDNNNNNAAMNMQCTMCGGSRFTFYLNIYCFCLHAKVSSGN